MQRKTKTICTIGPASHNIDIFEKLVQTGMDVVRLNFSHATYEQYSHIKALIDQSNKKNGKEVKILIDLQGPRIRIGTLPKEGIELKEGQEVTFTTNPTNEKAIFINDPYLHTDILQGHTIYLANGDMELKVNGVEKNEIKAKVIRGGILYSRKGVNLPDTTLTTNSLTEKDLLDIDFAIKNKTDYIAMSFVSDAHDILRVKDMLKNTPIQIIAKIERKRAIENLDKIIDASDIIMVARGDLGIELPLEELPLLQKAIVQKTNVLNKPSIVATQMLMSMVNHYRPTRAEVSDVANAVLDGAEYLMLSDETAFGKYPVEALDYLIKTINKIEEYQQTLN